MSYSIIRKITMSSGASGYLLDQDGITMVVSERDLYAQDIVTGLIDSGYHYHNYYGEILSPEGILISDLAATPIDPSDNDMFYGILGEQALTEQQMLEYFSGNNIEIKDIEMKKPSNILIHTRAELLTYLRGFHVSKKSTVPMSDCMPINSFTAPEALFTLEELWSNPDLYEYVSILSTRRTFVNNSHLRQLQDALIKEEVLTEENRWDAGAFLEAYSAWGPEGINAHVSATGLVEGNCSAINLPRGASAPQYVSNDFLGLQQAILNEGIDAYHARIKTKEVFVLLDKDGIVHFNGEEYPWQQVISCRTHIFFSDSTKSDIKRTLRNAAQWPTPYKAVLATYVVENPRVVQIIHDGNGVMHEWRCDLNSVTLVTTSQCLYAYTFAAIKTEYDKLIPLSDVYGENEYMMNNIFYKLSLEKSAEVRSKPAFSSTIKMAESCGMTYEQTIDYIEVTNGRKAASGVLHGSIPDSFYQVFGDKLEDTSEMSELDKLDSLLSRFYERTDADRESEDSWNYIDKLKDMDGSDDFNLAMFIFNSQIHEQIEAITDIRDDKVSLWQERGAVEDLSITNVGAIAYGLRTLYYIMQKEIDNNKLLKFVTDVKLAEVSTSSDFPVLLKDMMWRISGQARGCMRDMANLRFKQYTEGKQFVYVTSVVVEKSAAKIDERRHYSFNGYAMRNDKQLTAALFDVLRQAERVLNKIPFIYDELRDTIGKMAVIKTMEHIWEILFGSKEYKIGSNGECIFPVKLYDIEHENFMSIDVSLPKQVFDEVITAKSNIRPVCSTLFSFCRNSIISIEGNMSFEAVLLNARINPWYIEPITEGKEFPLFNGAVNIFPRDSFDEMYQRFLPEVYKEVKSKNGRLPISIYDDEYKAGLFNIDLSSAVIDEDIFEAINKRNGGSGHNIPEELYNYYWEDDSKTESTKQFVQRFNLITAMEAKKGNTVLAIPLKSDKYYRISADIYGIRALDGPVVTSMVSKPVFNSPIIYNATDIAICANNTNKVRFDTISVYDLVTNIEVATNGFTPSNIYFVGNGFIFLAGNNQATKISDISLDGAIALSNRGLILQINANSFLLKGINTVAVLEVFQ